MTGGGEFAVDFAGVDSGRVLVGQRQFWRKPSVFATRSVSEGLYLTRSLAYASGYYFGKSGAVQLRLCLIRLTLCNFIKIRTRHSSNPATASEISQLLTSRTFFAIDRLAAKR